MAGTRVRKSPAKFWKRSTKMSTVTRRSMVEASSWLWVVLEELHHRRRCKWRIHVAAVMKQRLDRRRRRCAKLGAAIAAFLALFPRVEVVDLLGLIDGFNLPSKQDC